MKFKKTIMSAALEEMLAFPEEQVEPLTEEEVQVFEDTEGDDLVKGINVAVEAIEQLECLITTMESAKADSNFGKYNLPLYQSSLEGICKSLGVKLTRLSQEAFGGEAVLSTEGLKDMASKVIQTIKVMLVRFVTWFKNTFTSQNAAIMRMTKGNMTSFSKLNPTDWNPKATVFHRSEILCGFYYHQTKGSFNNLSALQHLISQDIPKIDDCIGKLDVATGAMKDIMGNKPEDFHSLIADLLIRYAKEVGSEASYRQYAERVRSGNSEDSRDPTKVKSVTVQEVGDFHSVEKVCKDFTNSHYDYSHDHRANRIGDAVAVILSHLESLEKQGVAVPASVFRPIRDAIHAANYLCTIRNDLLYHTNVIIGKALRAGVGDDAKDIVSHADR